MAEGGIDIELDPMERDEDTTNKSARYNYEDEYREEETDFGGHDDSFTPFRPFHGESIHDNPTFERR